MAKGEQATAARGGSSFPAGRAGVLTFASPRRGLHVVNGGGLMKAMCGNPLIPIFFVFRYLCEMKRPLLRSQKLCGQAKTTRQPHPTKKSGAARDHPPTWDAPGCSGPPAVCTPDWSGRKGQPTWSQNGALVAESDLPQEACSASSTLFFKPLPERFSPVLKVPLPGKST